jgi:hypothetical protein
VTSVRRRRLGLHDALTHEDGMGPLRPPDEGIERMARWTSAKRQDTSARSQGQGMRGHRKPLEKRVRGFRDSSQHDADAPPRRIRAAALSRAALPRDSRETLPPIRDVRA